MRALILSTLTLTLLASPAAAETLREQFRARPLEEQYLGVAIGVCGTQLPRDIPGWARLTEAERNTLITVCADLAAAEALRLHREQLRRTY